MPARPNNKLCDSIRIGLPLPVQRVPALVIVIVASQYNIHTMLGHERPDIAHARGISLGTIVEQRVMKVCHGAGGMIGGEILQQPLILRGSGQSLVELARRVQADDMPAGSIEAIVVGNVIPVVEIPWSIV